LFESHCQQNHKDTPQKAENRYPEPPGLDRIIGNDHVPWYPGKYCSEEPEHEGQRTNMSKYFHGFSFLTIINEISANPQTPQLG
jgi:hypothetical protein